MSPRWNNIMRPITLHRLLGPDASDLPNLVKRTLCRSRGQLLQQNVLSVVSGLDLLSKNNPTPCMVFRALPNAPEKLPSTYWNSLSCITMIQLLTSPSE